MLIHNPPSLLRQWDSADAQRLSDFLVSATGQKALSHLAISSPPFDTGENPNVALVSAGRREGYELAVNTLIELTVHQPEPDLPPEKNSYPDLDDDKQWPKELQVENYVIPTPAPKPEEPTTPQ